jgi:hypothetical protein
MDSIANQCVSGNNGQAETVWIIRGPHRMKADVSTLHTLALQGWFLIRTAAGVQAHYADVWEGSA